MTIKANKWKFWNFSDFSLNISYWTYLSFCETLERCFISWQCKKPTEESETRLNTVESKTESGLGISDFRSHWSGSSFPRTYFSDTRPVVKVGWIPRNEKFSSFLWFSLKNDDFHQKMTISAWNWKFCHISEFSLWFKKFGQNGLIDRDYH